MTAPESAQTSKWWPGRLLSLSRTGQPDQPEGDGASPELDGADAARAEETTGTTMIQTDSVAGTIYREDALNRHSADPSDDVPEGGTRAEGDEPVSQATPAAAPWTVAVPQAMTAGAFTRAAVEQAYRTAFGALRSYPDRYVQSLRSEFEGRLQQMRKTADDDVLAIDEQRAVRHTEIDAEAAEAITARRARLQQDLADAGSRHQDELQRA